MEVASLFIAANQGTVTWSGSGAVNAGGGSVFNNNSGGVFDIQSDTTYQHTSANPLPSFTNAGTVRKSAGTATSSFSSVPYSNTGTVEVQTGKLLYNNTFNQTSGEMRLAGGSVSGSTLNFTGGILSGTSTATAAVTNNGAIVRPGSSPGVLTITGSYTQSATGILQVELGGISAGGGFDQLKVSGAASLAGTLDVLLLNGFTPAAGDTFPVVTFGSRSGTFSNINLPTLSSQFALAAQYSSSSVTLAVNPELVVSKTGTGTGTVTSNPSGIDCGLTCQATFNSGQVVTLTALPNSGSIFTGWRGDSDCSDGTVTMSIPRNCVARFDLPQSDLTRLKGDFNADGKSDIVWQNTDGSTSLWLMDGKTMASGAGLIGANTGWSVKQRGDFNADGKTDIVWQNTDGSAAV